MMTLTAECRSLNRRKERVHRLGNTASKTMEKSVTKINDKEDKDLLTLQQKHTQSPLDMIHSYSCHADWKDRVNRYIQKRKDEKENKDQVDDEQEDFELEKVEFAASIADENKAKYVTNSYGFGVDHRFVCLDKYFDFHVIYIQPPSFKQYLFIITR